MPSLNKALLIGNLTRDPDLRYTGAGTAVANLRLAVNRTFTVQGEKREDTLFIDVVAWGKQAETCAEYLAKGSAILVEVVADTVQFLTRKPGAPAAASGGAEIPAGTAAGADDDVPF